MNEVRERAVVITGASSGIGRAAVARMVQSGWRVFGTVRKPQDGESLRSEFGTAVHPIILNVTDPASVNAAAQAVSAALQGPGLDGLVNVAGIGKVAPVEYLTPDGLLEIFNINLFGQLAVTQALLPRLRAAHGRIVNITSVGAHIAIPFGSPINASKSAFGIFSDTLRLELHPFGIHVAVIEPGAIHTPAVNKTLGNVEGVIRDLPPNGAAQYGDMLMSFARRAYQREIHGSSPDVVAHAIQHALTAARPRIRYRVGKHSTLLSLLATFFPDRLLDKIRLRIAGMPGQFGAATSLKGQSVRDAA